MKKQTHSNKKLFDLLLAAIDGIDGYESENGDLRYWDSVKINKARLLIDKVQSKTEVDVKRENDNTI